MVHPKEAFDTEDAHPAPGSCSGAVGVAALVAWGIPVLTTSSSRGYSTFVRLFCPEAENLLICSSKTLGGCVYRIVLSAVDLVALHLLQLNSNSSAPKKPSNKSDKDTLFASTGRGRDKSHAGSNMNKEQWQRTH